MFRALFLTLLLASMQTLYAQTASPDLTAAAQRVETTLVARYGERIRANLHRGIAQVKDFWRAEDGDAAVFEQFVQDHFAGDEATRDALFSRYQRLMEQMDGHMLEIVRELRTQADLDLGPVLPADEIFAGYDPAAHLSDDLFANKLAFTVLLNFPLTTLEQRLAEGSGWSRRQWAETRLANRFAKRIPASVNLELAGATAEAEAYISGYNIWMHHLVNDSGVRLFPGGMRLLSHWNLRDQIKADYAAPSALEKQRMIQQVMRRIVTQTIPAAVVDNPGVDWNPYTNEVKPAAVKDDAGAVKTIAADAAAEPDTRYATLLKTFKAAQLVDPYSPTAKTLIDRRFNENRELPEARVRKMLVDVLTSPLVPGVARAIEGRLGRKLEPFDIWYNGFKPKAKHSEAELDAMTRQRYPSAAAFKADIPNILQKLGWEKARAEWIAARIEVDPARGSGHAWGSAMRSANAHLRTRVEPAGMNYKGYNIAVHELGHNVEQVLSMNEADYYTLNGVPNTAFTEALAFVFQSRDQELLGVGSPDPGAESLTALNDFWAVYEIAGVALVDMDVWHWMYDHPDATPAELKEAVLDIARETWNRYYAPAFGVRDEEILAVYSHMIDAMLYLPDYPIGHLIAHQVDARMRESGAVATEFERMVRSGSIAPDLWMQTATGKPVSADALLQSAGEALETILQDR